MSEPLLIEPLGEATMRGIRHFGPGSITVYFQDILDMLAADARVVERLTHFYRNSPGYDGGYPTEDEARAQAIRTRDALFGAPK